MAENENHLAERVKAMPYWYHRIELPGGVITPGWAPLVPAAYCIPADLTGKRVLDVGAWDGYWTFEALKRGAAEVVAIDNFEKEAEWCSDRLEWQTFDLCREAFGYGEERCKRATMSVYDAAQLGNFDVILFFGTLYHLRHPLLALDVLSGVCREALYVESAVCDDFSPYHGLGNPGHPRQMIMEFYPGDQLGGDPSNWWAPTLPALAYMVKSCGWPDVRAWQLMRHPQKLAQCRGFIRAQRLQEAA